jgi:hypothetical protein
MLLYDFLVTDCLQHAPQLGTRPHTSACLCTTPATRLIALDVLLLWLFLYVVTARAEGSSLFHRYNCAEAVLVMWRVPDPHIGTRRSNGDASPDFPQRR